MRCFYSESIAYYVCEYASVYAHLCITHIAMTFQTRKGPANFLKKTGPSQERPRFTGVFPSARASVSRILYQSCPPQAAVRLSTLSFYRRVVDSSTSLGVLNFVFHLGRTKLATIIYLDSASLRNSCGTSVTLESVSDTALHSDKDLAVSPSPSFCKLRETRLCSHLFRSQKADDRGYLLPVPLCRG